jgi:hypothetical protein
MDEGDKSLKRGLGKDLTFWGVDRQRVFSSSTPQEVRDEVICETQSSAKENQRYETDAIGPNLFAPGSGYGLRTLSRDSSAG